MVNKRKVFVGMVKQNCYVQACSGRIVLPTDHTVGNYYSLEEKVREDGSRIEELVKKDYPITPETLQSFYEATNYKADPVQAQRNSVKRQNLGDITGMQELLSLDSEKFQSTVASLRDKLSQIEALKKQANKKKEEVKDNG